MEFGILIVRSIFTVVLSLEFDSIWKTMCFVFDVLVMFVFHPELLRQRSLFILLECSIALRSTLNYKM